MNETSTELAPRSGSLQVLPDGQRFAPSNPIGPMLEAITHGGVTTDNAAALEKMMDLYLKVEAVNARKAFAEAKAALQADIPHIVATKPVPNRDGSIRYCYAPYQSIMREVEPFLAKHGFSISFGQKVEEKRLTAICTLTHIGGHEACNEFAVRVGQGPPSSSEAQADGAASTYAKRFALCNCLNITVDMPDDDARRQGDVITAAQAADLERRLKAVNGNVESFLRLADAESFTDIRSDKYAMLDAALTKKARSSTIQPAPQRAPVTAPAVTDEEVATFEAFHAACEGLVMGDWQPSELAAAMGALCLAQPLRANTRAAVAARKLVLTAWRDNRISKEGKVL